MTASHPWTGWLGELVRIRRSELQLAQYLAVQAGIRRSMDDWIPAARFAEFVRLMERWGMKVAADCIFRPLAGEGTRGLELAPTTRAQGLPMTELPRAGAADTVHAVVSSRADWAEETLASAWYPVAVRGSVVAKPLADFHHLGLAFGYPPCCVEFFRRHNDWSRQNSIAEAARASREVHWLANRLPKATPWMLIFHLPCSFDCAATRRQAAEVLACVRAADGDYARRIEAFLRQPYLSLSERSAFALSGGEVLAPGKQCEYSRAIDLERDNAGRTERERRNAATLAAGDALAIDEGAVYVYRRGELTGVIEPRCDRGVVEVPVLLDFR